MKTLKILLAVIVLMSTACREKTTENKVAPLQSVTDEIIYSVPIMNPLDSSTTNENVALAERELFLKTIFDAATTGKLVVYSDPEFKTVLKPDEITTADPAPIDTTKKKEVKKDSAAIKISPVIDFKKIERISFIEQWSIDSASYSIVKTIKGYSPLIGVYIEDPKLKTKIFKGWKSVFWVKCK